MSHILLLSFICFTFIIAIVFLVGIIRIASTDHYHNVEDVEVETISHYEPAADYSRSPFLKREYTDSGQMYVIDPADQEQIFINAFDDMYEDANGNVWRLR